MRAQSAMEYLMTYGWAIIIILVVLGVLYLLNVFNPGGLVGTTCSANFKYQCLAPYITTNGLLTFTFGQNTGSTEYNLAFACSDAQNVTTGEPFANLTKVNSGGVWYYMNSTGFLTQVKYLSFGEPKFMQTEQTITVNSLQCFDQNGNIPNSPYSSKVQVGAPITEKIWVKFTNAPGANSTSNPYIDTQVATLSTTVGVS